MNFQILLAYPLNQLHIGYLKQLLLYLFQENSIQDIRNIDLVKEILGLISKFDVEFIKIKAHQKPTSIVNYNIEVDKLSRKLVREGIN